MSPFDARTTRERNGEMISRGEAMSPFDAPAPFFSEAMSPFDARALDFFGPLRGAGILKSNPLNCTGDLSGFHPAGSGWLARGGGGPAASYSRGNREIAWMEWIRDRL